MDAFFNYIIIILPSVKPINALLRPNLWRQRAHPPKHNTKHTHRTTGRPRDLDLFLPFRHKQNQQYKGSKHFPTAVCNTSRLGYTWYTYIYIPFFSISIQPFNRDNFPRSRSRPRAAAPSQPMRHSSSNSTTWFRHQSILYHTIEMPPPHLRLRLPLKNKKATRKKRKTKGRPPPPAQTPSPTPSPPRIHKAARTLSGGGTYYYYHYYCNKKQKTKSERASEPCSSPLLKSPSF